MGEVWRYVGEVCGGMWGRYVGEVCGGMWVRCVEVCG